MSENSYKAFAGAYLERLGKTLFQMKPSAVGKAVGIIEEARKNGATVWLIGNGGSYALACHMAVDLRLADVRAMVLGDGTGITAAANDNSFEFSFVVDLDVLAKKGDVLIAISGSGNSPNIVRATEWAKGNGLVVIGFAGFTGGKMTTDVLIHAPVEHMGQAQDVQQILLHTVAYYLMEGTGGEKEQQQ